MNKKILSIFVMVMALSLLGVSCNNKSTNPDNQKEEVTVNPEDVKAINTALNGLGATVVVKASDDNIATSGTDDGQKFYFTTITATDETTTSHTITGTDSGSVAAVKASALGEYIKTQLSSSSINVTYNTPTGNDSLVVTAKKGTATVTVTINPTEEGWK